MLPGIPKFPSYHEHRKHIVVHMAAVFRNWARNGYTEGISGHISVRDPEFPDLIWMNPIGKHFALLNGSDMLCLRISDGEVVGGNRVSLHYQPYASVNGAARLTQMLQRADPQTTPATIFTPRFTRPGMTFTPSATRTLLQAAPGPSSASHWK